MDLNAPQRKEDHIALALDAQTNAGQLSHKFYYEPMLNGHPLKKESRPFSFLTKEMTTPIWVSSMTGGTKMAHTINRNLAQLCRDFGMGMGLGSCRSLLYSDEYLKDFDVRNIIGDALPFYANLGIAQVEQLIEQKAENRILLLVEKLRADGLIVHVNPLQEWLQPEGDQIKYPPVQTISSLLDKINIPLIVKEVGQGMGYQSLKALLQLPLQAIEFAAGGGTNFALLELLRSNDLQQKAYKDLAFIGHSAEEMVDMTNQIVTELGDDIRCREIIISGGVKGFLDGYYLTEKINLSAIYGQASGFLKHATGDYETLHQYVDMQVKGLALAKKILTVK